MPDNIFDRQFFGDLSQFDTTTAFIRNIIEPTVVSGDSIGRLLALSRTIVESTVSVLDSITAIILGASIIQFITRIKQSLNFTSRVKQSLSFTTRIKDTEDKTI